MGELRICANCNYERGFHIFFKRNKGRIKICLICPNCGQSYDLGWTTSAIKTFKAEKGIGY